MYGCCKVRGPVVKNSLDVGGGVILDFVVSEVEVNATTEDTDVVTEGFKDVVTTVFAVDDITVTVSDDDITTLQTNLACKGYISLIFSECKIFKGKNDAKAPENFNALSALIQSVNYYNYC